MGLFHRISGMQAAGRPEPASPVLRRHWPGASLLGRLDPAEGASWIRSRPASSSPPGPRWMVPPSMPEASARGEDEPGRMPEAGQEFLGFLLVAELGRGAFARVFLANQGELADRPVVLKVASRLDGETGSLARLQHTHVVPIYSVHRSGALQAICMPYLGPSTLADVLRDLAGRADPPGSGKDLLASLKSRSRERPAAATAAAHGPGPLPATPTRSRAESEAATATRRMLEGMSYVESALWIASCLADGLAHAHERGILHRDLKPANVLITDEGQPLLLDFNLSQDLRRPEGAGASVGGTLPYMSPEHLEAFRGAAPPPDARADVYSLGVMLYEMLAGRRPFASQAAPTLAEGVGRMVEERRQGPPDLRRRNGAVSPAVASIVRRCLEPDPDRRYQSADELREDLRLQLEHRPLRHAPDPSPRERVRKWAKRHPRLASSSTLGLVALTVVLSVAGGLVLGLYWAGERDRAREALARFERGLHEARSALFTSRIDGPRRREGVASCLRALEGCAIGEGGRWQSAELVRHLDQGDLARLAEGRGEALWLLAQAARLEASDAPGGGATDEGLRKALALNREAQACYPADGVPAALLTQRSELLRRLGRRDEARRWAEAAAATPLRTPRDHYLAAAEQVLLGRFEAAGGLLETATRLAPGLSWAWFLRGVCHDRLGQEVDALGCYQACLALRPDDAWAHFNRGLIHLRRGDPARALADFDGSLRLDSGRVESILNRALALQGLGRHAEAIRGLDLALELGASPARTLFLRARVREDAGDLEGAARDRALGMAARPEDGPGWSARGLARSASDPEGALADFGEALRLEPDSIVALQGSARVLAGLPGRSDEAVAALGRALEVDPGHVPARIDRGSLLARLGRRDEALRDAREALARDASPAIAYEAAGVYAQTSRRRADDAEVALGLLTRALRGGAGWDLLVADPDLAPIRGHPDFQRLIRAAPALAAGRAGGAG